MTANELCEPLTPIDLAELHQAATMPGHQLTEAGIKLLRRALFQLDWHAEDKARLDWLEENFLSTGSMTMERGIRVAIDEARFG